MSDDSYFIEKSRQPYKPYKGKPFDPNRRTRPLWTNLRELRAVLAQYGRWYEQGLSDYQISRGIEKLR